MQAREGAGQSFVVLGKPPKPHHPREGSLHHPSARQQDESSFGPVNLPDNRCDILVRRVGLGLIAGVALIGLGQVYRSV